MFTSLGHASGLPRAHQLRHPDQSLFIIRHTERRQTDMLRQSSPLQWEKSTVMHVDYVCRCNDRLAASAATAYRFVRGRLIQPHTVASHPTLQAARLCMQPQKSESQPRSPRYGAGVNGADWLPSLCAMRCSRACGADSSFASKASQFMSCSTSVGVHGRLCRPEDTPSQSTGPTMQTDEDWQRAAHLEEGV